jgi:hypothetical protein
LGRITQQQTILHLVGWDAGLINSYGNLIQRGLIGQFD